jgi:two-component system alkaline phosphatase synthesis response regulator PhoP
MATVLIVDDEPDIVLFVRINMEMDGHEVIAASDGEEALAVVAERRPDAIVLDVMMPKLDGWAVLERLKSDPDESVRTIPVVMLTALGSGQDQVRGGIEGAVRYLPKPVAPDELIAAVRSAIEGGPEPVQRKAAQQRALERLARIERGADGASSPSGAPRPRLGRLEHPRTAAPPPPTTTTPPPAGPAEALTDKQRTLLRTLKATASVTDAADELDMSRSNIYASLRRVGRKLDVPDVTELLRRLRAGRLDSVIEG